MVKHLYIHIPFCWDICSYCDFCKVFYQEKQADQYLDALEKDIKKQDIRELITIYIGGGTPSSLNYRQLNRLMQLLKPFLSDSLKEFSIEVNPESMDYEKLLILKRGGLNRLSIGVQTFNEDLLKLVDRHHNNDQVFSLISQAKELGINNINIDLMYGLPRQSQADIIKDLETVKELEIKHISYYSLILEDYTKLKKTTYQPLDDEESASLNKLIDQKLAIEGFIKYEVSNYAQAGYQSLHNMSYWLYKDYLGLGAGAASKIGDTIRENSRSITGYIQGKDIHKNIVQTKEDLMFNEIMMGLRLIEGIDILAFNRKYNVDLFSYYQEAIDKYLGTYLLVTDNYLKCSPEGIYFLNQILLDFMN